MINVSRSGLQNQAIGIALEAAPQNKQPQKAASELAQGLLAPHILHHRDKVSCSSSS